MYLKLIQHGKLTVLQFLRNSYNIFKNFKKDMVTSNLSSSVEPRNPSQVVICFVRFLNHPPTQTNKKTWQLTEGEMTLMGGQTCPLLWLSVHRSFSFLSDFHSLQKLVLSSKSEMGLHAVKGIPALKPFFFFFCQNLNWNG